MRIDAFGAAERTMLFHSLPKTKRERKKKKKKTAQNITQ